MADFLFPDDELTDKDDETIGVDEELLKKILESRQKDESVQEESGETQQNTQITTGETEQPKQTEQPEQTDTQPSAIEPESPEVPDQEVSTAITPEVVDDDDSAKSKFKNRWTEFTAINNQFPNKSGEEFERALDEWSFKYNNKSYEDYKLEQSNKSLQRHALEHTGKTAYNILAGTTDFAVNTLNLGGDIINWSTRGPIGGHIPDIPDIPKMPMVGGEGYQVVRGASEIIVPSLVGGWLIKGGVATYHAGRVSLGSKAALPKLTAIGQKISKKPVYKFIAENTLDAGVSVGVDFIASTPSAHDNPLYQGQTLTGKIKRFSAKDNWLPNWFGFLPDNAVVQNGDDPADVRAAHITEGFYLHWAITSVRAGGMLWGLSKTNEVIQPVTKANKKYRITNTSDKFDTQVFDENNPLSDAVLRELARVDEAYDLLGKAELELNPSYIKNPPKKAITGLTEGIDIDAQAVTPKGRGGITGAQIDAARIADNIDTYADGNIRTVIDEYTRKIGLTLENLTDQQIVKKLAKEIENIGPFDAKTTLGTLIPESKIDKAAATLAEILVDPRMNAGDLKKVVNEFKDTTELGVKKLTNIGNKAAIKAVDYLQKTINDFNFEKARGLLVTSEAGELSTIANATMELPTGHPAIPRALERMIDRTKLLMAEVEFAKFENNLRTKHLSAFKGAIEKNIPEDILKIKTEIRQSLRKPLRNRLQEIENYTNELKAISEVNPEWLKPMIAAWATSGGNVDTLHKLNANIKGRLGVFAKAFHAGDTNTQSIIVEQLQGISFNNMLSAPSTISHATIGNLTGLASSPITKMLGSGANFKNMQRTWVQYTGFRDAFSHGLDYMGQMYKRAAKNDPVGVGSLMRDDLHVRKAFELQELEAYAKLMAKQGDYGPQTLLGIYADLHELAQTPWLKYGTNSMIGLDGFNRAMIATATARGEAWDDMIREGVEVTKGELKRRGDIIYNKMFDKDTGLLTDEAVEFMSSETALNLNTNLSKGISDFVKKWPVARLLFWFPKTQANMMELTGKYLPGPTAHYANELHLLSRGWRDWKNGLGWVESYDTLLKENPNGLREFLARRGIKSGDPNVKAKFASIASEIRGRQIAGGFVILGTNNLVANNMIRGNGHWDPRRQELRRRTGWQPMTYYDPIFKKWRDYSWMGPIARIIAANVDLWDNFDGISTKRFEQWQLKLGTVLSASIINETALRDIEPIQALIAGDYKKLNRFIASNVINPLVPLTGLRRDMGKIISPELDAHNQSILEYTRSNNKWLNAIDKANAQAKKINPFTNKELGYAENFWTRVANVAKTPLKSHDKQTDIEEWLTEIEYDLFTKLTSPRGLKLSVEQQEAILAKIGEGGLPKSEGGYGDKDSYQSQLREIMNKANRIKITSKTGEEITGFINVMKYHRANSVQVGQKKLDYESQYKQYYGVITDLDKVLKYQIERAWGRIAREGDPLFLDILQLDATAPILQDLIKQGRREEADLRKIELNKNRQNILELNK